MRAHLDQYAESRIYADRVVAFRERVENAGMELCNETSRRFGLPMGGLAPVAAEHPIWSLTKDGHPIATRATLAQLEKGLDSIIERLASLASWGCGLDPSGLSHSSSPESL